MASSTKKRAEKNMESDNSDDSFVDEEMESDDENNELFGNEEVQVDFEARTMEDGDFHGIKTLLQQTFLKANINVSQLTDTLISQNYIGCVIKQVSAPDEGGDDDSMDSDDNPVFGLMSVINLTERKELECIKQTKKMLIDKCREADNKKTQQFTSLLEKTDCDTGLLLNERFINIPPQISVPMFDSVMKDMEKAKRKNMKYDFGQYLMISKTFTMPGGDKKNPQLFFTNSEEEFLLEACDFSFTYSVQKERDTIVDGKWDGEVEDQMEALRTVMIISAEKFPKALEQIKSELAST